MEESETVYIFLSFTKNFTIPASQTILKFIFSPVQSELQSKSSEAVLTLFFNV